MVVVEETADAHSVRAERIGAKEAQGFSPGRRKVIACRLSSAKRLAPLLLYSVVALYQQQQAYRCMAEGVRRLRRLVWKERLQVVVYDGSIVITTKPQSPMLASRPMYAIICSAKRQVGTHHQAG